MRSKSYFILFPLYIVAGVFVLYLNGVFGGEVVSLSNLVINGVFLAIIGILFVISSAAFARLNRCSAALGAVGEKMLKEYKEAGNKNVWMNYQDRREIFGEEALDRAFQKYCLRMRNYHTRRGYGNICDIEEYINEDLLDQVGMTYFNSGIAGTLTGLGILGTFLGLALGLGSFQGNDIFTISDNVGPLLAGMKVAFHTSVYGIFFSLVFNFIYRGVMADAYGKLEDFLNLFRQCVQPVVATENENGVTMLVYQANIANSMKQILELLQGNSKEQTKELEQIVNRFVQQMDAAMGVNLQKMGAALKETADSQAAYALQCEKLTKASAGMTEINRAMYKNLEQLMERQEIFARELLEQKEKIAKTCEEISDEVSSQLYTYEQMRSLYEK